jgi:predicted alpha/beta hydrolase family esterase
MSSSPHCNCQARLLIVPGLHDSPPEHWQSWLQRQHRDAVRVQQRDWAKPDLERWSARVDSTLARHGGGSWLAVAHSFGVLALLHHLAHNPASPVVAALLVAPADPDKFGLGALLPQQPPGRPTTMVLSSNDPWLPALPGRRWAARWGSQVVELGAAGHINVEAGFRSLPLAQRWVAATEQRLVRERRAEVPQLLSA